MSEVEHEYYIRTHRVKKFSDFTDEDLHTLRLSKKYWTASVDIQNSLNGYKTTDQFG